MVDSLLDWMEDRGAGPKLALLLLSTVGVSLIVFQFVVAPQRQRAQALQQTLQSLDHRLGALNNRLGPLAGLDGEMDVMAPRVEAQKKFLGIHGAVDHLLPDIVDAAHAVGVTLTSWQPEAPMSIPGTTLHRVMLRLDAEGRYHDLARFLKALPTLPKTLIVRSMDYRVRQGVTEDAAIGIQASFRLVGFQSAVPVRIGSHAPGGPHAEG